jgi:transposase InsO family protein
LLLEGGLVAQNILDLPEEQRPELVNDRGRQMKAKPIQRLCEDHGMPQLFARPRTPNDNPCHRADQNQPLVGVSKPATLRRESHNSFFVGFKEWLAAR